MSDEKTIQNIINYCGREIDRLNDRQSEVLEESRDYDILYGQKKALSELRTRLEIQPQDFFTKEGE